MKISVLSDASGEIVAAFFTPPDARAVVGRAATDHIKIPEKHRVHEADLPPELAGELLSGNFAKAIDQYNLVVKGKKATLQLRASEK